MDKKNYYISLYKAILDKNLSKALELDSLEVKVDYPEEYPELNFVEIFQEVDPKKFIDRLSRSKGFKEFSLRLDDARNPLGSETNVALREQNHLNLMQHPLINYSPNLFYKNYLFESLISVCYSIIFNKKDVEEFLLNLMAQSYFIEDILSVVGSSILSNSDEPFSIALLGENIEEYDPTLDKNSGGGYNTLSNRILVTNENLELNKEFIIHELSHKAIDLIFDNGADPYSNSNSKDQYHLAIKNTLLNIKEFIKQDFGLDINFENQDDTWQMGKVLSTILFPQYLSTQNIGEFISFFKEYNLNINKKFSWLGGALPIGIFLQTLKFDLADELIANGAVIPELKNSLALSLDMDLLDWILENFSEVDINLKDQEGMTALDYAQDSQIIAKLISLGAIAYPTSYELICLADYEYPENEEDIDANNQLYALEKLLNFYNQGYDQSDEDAEFIVRLPQIITAGLYEGPIVEIFKPVAEYWHEVISPAAESYQAEHYIGDICFASTDYAI